jgi:hypothetical protein
MASNVATRDVALDESASILSNVGAALDGLLTQANAQISALASGSSRYGSFFADIEQDPAHATAGTYANAQYLREQALLALFTSINTRAQAIVTALTGL